MFKKIIFTTAVVATALSLAACSSLGNQQENQPTKPPAIQPTEQQGAQTQGVQEQPAPQVQAAICEAKIVKPFIGKVASTELLEEIRIKTLAQIVRVLHPQQAVTLEFSPTRANVYVNESYIIQNVECF